MSYIRNNLRTLSMQCQHSDGTQCKVHVSAASLRPAHSVRSCNNQKAMLAVHIRTCNMLGGLKRPESIADQLHSYKLPEMSHCGKPRQEERSLSRCRPKSSDIKYRCCYNHSAKLHHTSCRSEGLALCWMCVCIWPIGIPKVRRLWIKLRHAISICEDMEEGGW